MNKIIITSLFAALSGIILAPAQARAGDREVVAAVGGFIGGVIVGSHFHSAPPPPRRVIVAPSVVVGRPAVVVRDHRRHDRGHWEWVSVRVWVPARWVVVVDDCGRRHRSYVRGHHEYRRERQWVSYSSNRRGWRG